MKTINPNASPITVTKFGFIALGRGNARRERRPQSPRRQRLHCGKTAFAVPGAANRLRGHGRRHGFKLLRGNALPRRICRALAAAKHKILPKGRHALRAKPQRVFLRQPL